MENVFSDFGAIVYGDRFIGRHREKQIIYSRLVAPKDPGNLAIIGDPRVGKSSLAYDALVQNRDRLKLEGKHVCWLDMGLYENSRDFFDALMLKAHNELADNGFLSSQIAQQYNDYIAQQTGAWPVRFEGIKRFFQSVRGDGQTIICVLDEFDNARRIFANDIVGFQALRELSYMPEWKVAFLTTSRRTVKDIEIASNAISNFDGIFQKIHLGLFEEADYGKVIDNMATHVGREALPDDQMMRGHCGRHPFLLDMFSYYYLMELSGSVAAAATTRAMAITDGEFCSHYQRLRTLYEEDGRFARLVHILLGYAPEYERTAINDFMQRGVLMEEDGCLQPFSQHFAAYIHTVASEPGLWTLWHQVEHSLRRLIRRRLEEALGENWISKVSGRSEAMQKIFTSAAMFQQREISSFGNRASREILDFTYPYELFQIMMVEWGNFKDLLGRDKGYWNTRAQLLAKVRNPMAHNRINVLSEAELCLARGYCHEIIEMVQRCGYAD